MNGAYAVPSANQEDIENALQNRLLEEADKENPPH
jgi:hypothetical protein